LSVSFFEGLGKFYYLAQAGLNLMAFMLQPLEWLMMVCNTTFVVFLLFAPGRCQIPLRRWEKTEE
jgi:hypothetical protein